MKVFGRMTVGRRVAATDVAARQAQAQVHPFAADPQAIFATVSARSDFHYLIEM